MREMTPNDRDVLCGLVEIALLFSRLVLVFRGLVATRKVHTMHSECERTLAQRSQMAAIEAETAMSPLPTAAAQ